LNNKKKKINNTNNKKSFSNQYIILGIAVLIAIAGVVISYPYFVSSNANLESSSDRSNLLGDWHDIHGVGLFDTKGSSNDENNSIYIATHNGLYNKKQSSSWVKVGSDKSDLMGFVINPMKEGVMYSSGHLLMAEI
jgi:hypothetical protein